MGDPETKRFRSLGIDHKFKFGRLKYRQISRSLALENSAGIDAHLPVQLRRIRPVAHQTTCVAEFAPKIHRRDRMPRRQLNKLVRSGGKKRSCSYKKSSRSLPSESRKNRIDFTIGTRLKYYEFLSNQACCFLRVPDSATQWSARWG
jgi:hypothetical protein